MHVTVAVFQADPQFLCVCVCCSSSFSIVGSALFPVHQHVGQKTCLQGK
jgi:hypothetical protein